MAAPYEVDGKTVLVMTVEKGDNPPYARLFS